MSKKAENTIYKGILGAFLILIMHVALLGIIGILILFFHGIVNYLGYIIIGMSCSVIIWWYWFYRRSKKHSSVVRGIVEDSILSGKSVEISLFGGAATFKVGDSKTAQIAVKGGQNTVRQLESPKPDSVDTLTDLGRLYEKKLITAEEFEKAKKNILK